MTNTKIALVLFLIVAMLEYGHSEDSLPIATALPPALPRNRFQVIINPNGCISFYTVIGRTDSLYNEHSVQSASIFYNALIALGLVDVSAPQTQKDFIRLRLKLS